MILKVLSFAALAGAVCGAVAILAAPACTTHQCDATEVSLGADAGTGEWFSYCPLPEAAADAVADAADADAAAPAVPPPAASNCSLIWASSDTMNSPWTDFPGNATLTFTYPPLPPLPPGYVPDFADITPLAWVAATAPAGDADDSFNVTPAAGQLAEFVAPWSPTSISVWNATCQPYRVLVHVTVPVIGPDGGFPPEGGLQDSGDADADSSTGD